MTDHWGNGRWGAGNRPNQPGMDQSNYDIGVMHRQQAQRQQLEDQRRRLTQNSGGTASQPTSNYYSPTASGNYTTRTNGGDGSFFIILIMLAFIGFLWWAALALWGVTIGTIYSTNATIIKAVELSGYAAGASGILTGYLLRHRMFKILKIAAIIALGLLLFVSAAGFLLDTFDPEWAR